MLYLYKEVISINYKVMSRILFIGGFTLIVAWVISVFAFHVNGTIHVLPIMAGIVLLIGLLYNKSFMEY